MGIRKWYFLALILAGLALFTTSCDTGEKRTAKTTPPPQALAPAIAAPTPTPAPKVLVEEQPAPKVDPDETMVAAAEKEYQEGRANYTAGHLHAAKQNFDPPFNNLLQPPLPLNTDEPLPDDF